MTDREIGGQWSLMRPTKLALLLLLSTPLACDDDTSLGGNDTDSGSGGASGMSESASTDGTSSASASDSANTQGAEGSDTSATDPTEASDTSESAGSSGSSDGTTGGLSGGSGDTGSESSGDEGTTGGDTEGSEETGDTGEFPPVDPPDNSTFELWYETLVLNGCQNPGANSTLNAPFGWGSSVFNDSGASFDVGVDRVRLELSMGGASITLPLPIEEPAPMLETVADGAFGGMPLAWDPEQPEVSAEACDYCGGGLWRLEGEFIVDGGSIGWFPSFQSQVQCN